MAAPFLKDIKMKGIKMTIPFRKHSTLAYTSLSRSLLLFAVLIVVAVAGPVLAADGTANTWRGSYHSNARNQEVTVRLTLPAGEEPGELRFVTLSCSVGLQSESGDPTGTAVYVIQPRQEAAGSYCGSWLGGRVETRSADGGQRLEMTVTHRNSKIVIKNLLPASGM